jgi:hypothetical protein
MLGVEEVSFTFGTSVRNVHRHLENIIMKSPKCALKKDWSFCKISDINFIFLQFRINPICINVNLFEG